MTEKKERKDMVIYLLIGLLLLETILGGSCFILFSKNVEQSGDIWENVILQEVSSVEDIDEWRNSGKPFMVIFGADYCSACINYKPYIKAIADSYAGEVIVKYVDTEENKSIREVYNIEAIPSTLFFEKDGTPYKPSQGLNVTKEEEAGEERIYVSEQFRIAKENEVLFNDQFEYGIDNDGELAYCKFQGFLDMIQLEEICMELIQ